MINAIIPKAAPPKELTLMEEVMLRLDHETIMKQCKTNPRWKVCERGLQRAIERNDLKLKVTYTTEAEQIYQQSKIELASGVLKRWEQGEGLEEVFMKKRESKGKRIKTNEFALNILLDVLHSICVDTESIYRSEDIDWNANQRENAHPAFVMAKELKKLIEGQCQDVEGTSEEEQAYEDESDKIYAFVMQRAGIYYRKLEKIKSKQQKE